MNFTTFETLLKTIHLQPWTDWVYLPANEVWTLSSKSVVLESEEVAPEFEDEPDADIPEFAKTNNLKRVLSVSNIQDIVSNARAQKLDVTVEELFQAFEYYYKNDAFINFSP
jgi:hypothetical protein